ncbi:50S ribosomal protein L19 [Patescibacteria group bacterium]|nr:50S ribosomal protein L19 [Patescibacteria group bacterium]
MALHLSYNDQTIAVGDTVRVHQRIMEEKRSRTQVFEGVVIAIRGKEAGKTFVVRKISVGGIGVEKIFPVMLPSIEKIELKRKGDVRRSKLNYLRDRVGKAASKVKEKSMDEQLKA